MAGQMTNKALPRLVELVRPPIMKHQKDFPRKLMENILKKHKLLSIPTLCPKNVAVVGGERSYMLLGSLAKLERALTKWSINELIQKHKFTPVIVPNIIHDHIVEKCGFPTKSRRSQVYKISGNNQESILDENSTKTTSDNRTHSCVAGTSEFALVSIHVSDLIPADKLPIRYCALSRCYRAETSSTTSEWGLYRVHYFNKVEMVALTVPERSSEMHEEFLAVQKDLFNQLGLHYQILDMPEDDLGLSASKKYDIEAWMDGRNRFGEISSTSNCRDYQASRLNIKYSKMLESDNELKVDTGFVHTVNGTACSTIRTLIAMVEQNQTESGRIDVPDPLLPYMGGIKSIPTSDDEKLLAEVDLYPKNE